VNRNEIIQKLYDSDNIDYISFWPLEKGGVTLDIEGHDLTKEHIKLILQAMEPEKINGERSEP
jgi:hypothetical protein